MSRSPASSSAILPLCVCGEGLKISFFLRKIGWDVRSATALLSCCTSGILSGGSSLPQGLCCMGLVASTWVFLCFGVGEVVCDCLLFLNAVGVFPLARAVSECLRGDVGYILLLPRGDSWWLGPCVFVAGLGLFPFAVYVCLLHYLWRG